MLIIFFIDFIDYFFQARKLFGEIALFSIHGLVDFREDLKKIEDETSKRLIYRCC